MKDEMNRWKKIYEILENTLGFVFLAFFFFVCGGFAGFMLIYLEPRSLLDCIVGTALLLDLAIILGWSACGMIMASKSPENNVPPEPFSSVAETTGETVAPGPAEHHVSYLGFFICFAIILMIVSIPLGERKMRAIEQGDKNAQVFLEEHDTGSFPVPPENKEP
jgi:ABC-type dipeptide/oligopeptide/nickel transport system permease component